jgi:DNA modification methylase
MRQLPSQSIDLIYIDPPFFSGKQYNVIFGDQNELRSFLDIWESGLPGYLIWLNARLYEMKRLLKKTGSIVVHCDWHASHYIKVEMDKIFGHDNFVNEIIWAYQTGGISKRWFARKHHVLLFYARDFRHLKISLPNEKSYTRTLPEPHTPSGKSLGVLRDKICELCGVGHPGQKYRLVSMRDVSTDIKSLFRNDEELIGYPTQKPVELASRLIKTCSSPGDTVADFFCGGGGFLCAAQGQRKKGDRLVLGGKPRRWIGCDQSRVAVAITADRIASIAEQISLEQPGDAFAVPDFTIEHWGIYEAKRLTETPPDQFRQFVLRAYGAVPDNSDPGIHGHKGAIPVWVGEPSHKSQVTAKEVVDFANAVRKTVRYQQDNLRDGTMLAWAFRPDAMQAAQQLREQEATDLNFIRLDMVRIDSPGFREHVQALSTDKADYGTFLTFVLPPRVEVGWKKLSGLTYRFDVSESIVLNSGGKLINVQWDFDHQDVFTSTQGYSFVRTTAKEPALQVDYTFPATGSYRIACKVQDDVGGEGLWSGYIEVK